MKKTNKKIIVVYHKNCVDGFGAAWVAKKKFGQKAFYIGVAPREFPSIDLTEKDVYFLDVSYKAQPIKKFLNVVKSLTIIDHHISLEKSTKLAHNYVYDVKHSGAVLAWKYFYPKKKIPKLLLHIEDIDIWKLSLPMTKELISALGLCEFDFSLWNRIASDWEKSATRKKYIDEGRLIRKYENKIIEKVVKDAQKVMFCGKQALVANSNLNLRSEIGDRMIAKGSVSVGIIWQQKGSDIIVSLRSGKKVDVSKMAAKFGGGGHKQASAFALPVNKPFPWKSMKK